MADEYEDSRNLHAILQGTSGPGNEPPAEWTEALKIHATRARRISLGWRRGAAPYSPIPGATLELPELASIKEGEAPEARREDPHGWARELARGRWSVAVDWARKNGPVIDVQLQIWGYDPKKGQFQVLKGGAIAKRVNLSGEGAQWMDDGSTVERTLASLVDRLLTRLDEKDQRMNEAWGMVRDHYDAMSRVSTGALEAFQRAMDLREKTAGQASGERAAERAFLVELAKVRSTEQAVNNTVSQMAPVLRDLAAAWAPAGGAADHQETARQLLETIDDEMRERWEKAGFSDLLTDIKSALENVAASEKLESAVASMRAIAPTLVRHQNDIGNLLSPHQRGLVVKLLQLPGVTS